eukprot:1161244-Pelagomonas_calceolata.AAC.20
MDHILIATYATEPTDAELAEGFNTTIWITILLLHMLQKLQMLNWQRDPTQQYGSYSYCSQGGWGRGFGCSRVYNRVHYD